MSRLPSSLLWARVVHMLACTHGQLGVRRVPCHSNNVSLPEGTIVEAWKSNVMPQVTAAGLRTINSYKCGRARGV